MLSIFKDWLFDTSGSTVNIDGSPMCGSVDIHGNPFGVTDCSTTSLFDDTSGLHSSLGCTGDLFSSTSSSFDDSFSSGMGCGSSMFGD